MKTAKEKFAGMPIETPHGDIVQSVIPGAIAIPLVHQSCDKEKEALMDSMGKWPGDN